ncbi:intramembrane metalloprotease PrsW [Priestia filamentosa]|uniref:glutamic-type intramembrane protease PrsW n=1 Tax=Priestia TaxID=2800373 RepID=UPI001FB456EA|nr:MULTISPECIES: glutamic-type intramembrane protease PrsW [Priestia]MCY8232769.1 glutamic-type intramembrane protease PrsW [Priestia endophytica]MED3725156.1 glutamic-type intramembrane protease PrsW [Priestia filamentosa]UOE61585.1 intramembrane metalloprotease PrsW [Priestia filamentosa]
MLAIISAGIAPGLALLSYFYLKDEYETEPISVVLKTFIFGAVLVLPIMFIQYVMQEEQVLQGAFLNSFLTTSFLEEYFKWFVLYFTIFQHVEFDEHYDGIVYGAAVSLGFATAENILYLVANGVQDAFARAVLPVSSHALFGVVMGYYLGKGKFFGKSSRRKWLTYSLFIPILLHGMYDYILRTIDNWMVLMIPFMVFLWGLGLWKVKKAKKTKPPVSDFFTPS